MFLCHLNRILVVLFPVLISPVLLYQCKEELGMQRYGNQFITLKINLIEMQSVLHFIIRIWRF